MYVSDLFSDVTYTCFRRFRRFRRFVFLFTVNSIISDALISIPVNSIISNGLISMISEIRLHIDFPELQPQLTVTLNSMISLPGSFSDALPRHQRAPIRCRFALGKPSFTPLKTMFTPLWPSLGHFGVNKGPYCCELRSKLKKRAAQRHAAHA